MCNRDRKARQGSIKQGNKGKAEALLGDVGADSLLDSLTVVMLSCTA